MTNTSAERSTALTATVLIFLPASLACFVFGFLVLFKMRIMTLDYFPYSVGLRKQAAA